MLPPGGRSWGAVYSINIRKNDMKLVFLAKPILLEFFMDGSPLAIYINPGIYDHPIPYCRRCFKNYGTQWLDLDQFRKISTHITGHWIC
jgi:hypothetical protein